jgi:hypothetical protein
VQSQQSLERRALLETTDSPPFHEQVAVTNSRVRCSYLTLAPYETIRQILDDWFTYVHPVAPILHRDSFMRIFDRQDAAAAEDCEFSALVISLCAATIAALRTTSAAYSNMITVEKCCGMLLDVDGLKGSLPVSLIRSQTKYNLAVSLNQERGMDAAECQLLMIETFGMVGRLVHYHSEEMSLEDRELSKRLYWLCFAGECTAGLHSRPYVIPSLVFSNFEASMPASLCDADLAPITPGEELWHGNTTSYIPGLIALSKIFMLWVKSQQGDCSNLGHLRNYLDLAASVLDDLPPALRWRGGLSRPLKSNFGTDVQMVNLYITQIHVRSFLMDQMHRAAIKAGDHAVVGDVKESRQALINDMLAIVYQMPEATLEANGFSLVGKLRDIGISLLDEENDPQLAYANLDRLLAKLDRLDTNRSNAFDSTSPHTSITSPISLQRSHQ